MRYAWGAILLLLAILAEILTATATQLPIPFFLLTAFYLDVATKTGWVTLPFAILLDLAFARRIPITIAPCLAALLVAFLWKKYGHLKSTLPQILPALVLSGLSLGVLFLYAGGISDRMLLGHLLGAILFPILLPCLDALARLAKLPRYKNANERK